MQDAGQGLPKPSAKLKKRKARKGFTLTELMLVVAIGGLFATIATPNYVAAEDKARNSHMTSNMRTLTIALENYRTEQHQYPPTIVDESFMSYLPGHHLPLAPWCKLPQTMQAYYQPPYDFDPQSWEGIVHAAKYGECPTEWLDDAKLSDAPNKYNSVGVVRYNYYADSDVYQMFGQGKRGEQRTLLSPLTNEGV